MADIELTKRYLHRHESGLSPNAGVGKMEFELGISVRDALTLDCLSGARIIAGMGGLDRVIRYVNVMEVPDIQDWVKEGEFLITTAYSIKDDPQAQRDLIPVLALRRLAALGIKPRRYLERIPQEMIDQANQHMFPLIEIPYEVSFGDIINPLMSEILNRQADFLKKIEQVHRDLMNVLLAEGGLGDIANTLEKLIESPVHIHNVLNDKAFYSMGCFDEAGVLKPDLFASENVIEVPIVIGGCAFGYLRVGRVNNRLSKSDVLTLERGATIAGLEILNQKAVFEVERRYRNEFLDDLLSGEIRNDEAILERGRLFGWDLSQDYAVAVAEIGRPGDIYRDYQPVALQDVKSRLIYTSGEWSQEGYAVAGEKGGNLVVFLRIPNDLKTPGKSKRFILQCGRKVLDRITSFLKQCGEDDTRVLVGIGRFHGPGPRSLKPGFDDAKVAVMIGRLLAPEGGVVHFDDLGVHRLLFQVSDPGEVSRFYEETVGPLIEYDQTHGTEFVKTLEAFFRQNGNLRKVASDLYAHYNTVLYRISRIKEITGLDLRNADHRLNAEIGLKIKGLYQHDQRKHPVSDRGGVPIGKGNGGRGPTHEFQGG